jgi:hypothetical protein
MKERWNCRSLSNELIKEPGKTNKKENGKS